MPGYQSRIEYYGDDRLLTSLNGKYGFISMNGYTSVPFKYDEVIHLDGQKFAVRIGKRWGAIDKSGREYVQVKYDDRINNRDAKFIMMDVESGCYGIISPSGYELVPCLYEHIIPMESYTFVGFGGYDTFPSDYGNGNFFSTINGAIWGCINEKGELIVPIKYDCLEIRDGYIIAGRDGGMLHHNDSSYGSDYSGVYDLYNDEGTMLFGGFRKVVIDNENGIFKAFFGGKWEYREIYYDEWNNNRIEDYSFDEGNGRWIALTTDFKPIPEPEDQPGFTYKVGFVGTMKERVEGNKRITTTNLPLKSLLKSNPVITPGFAIINRADKFQLVKLDDRHISEEYDSIVRVNDDLVIVCKNDKVGLMNNDGRFVLPLEYLAITKPVDNYSFCIKCTENKICDAFIVNFSNGISEPIKVIEGMDAGTMCFNLAIGTLKINSVNTNNQFIFRICDPSIFNKNLEAKRFTSTEFPREFLFDKPYWVSSNIVRKLYDESRNAPSDDNDAPDDYGPDSYDNQDYKREAWDAMTDGMYGDMPEGFDGDFDFLG